MICAVLGDLPESAMAALKQFGVEHRVEHALPEGRTASAWLSGDLMLGGESGGKKDGAQFHPATVHWRTGDEIGWIRVETFGALDVSVEKQKMRITLPHATPPNTAGFQFVISAPGADEKAFDHEHWRLPGLLVQIESNLSLSEPEAKDGLYYLKCAPPPASPVGLVNLHFSKNDEKSGKNTA
jgi:hypothetical protein